jgi:hypothetical protein
MLIPGRRSQGLILTCLIGVAGALAGASVTRLIRADGANHPVGWLSARCWLAGKLIMQYCRRDLLTRSVPSPPEGNSPRCAALLQGGSAPDALRLGLKSVGQAVRADGAKEGEPVAVVITRAARRARQAHARAGVTGW